MIHFSTTYLQPADSQLIHLNTLSPKPVDSELVYSVGKPAVPNVRNVVSPDRS